MAWGKAGSTDVTSGDALTVSSISDNKFNMVLYLAIPSGEMTEYMTMGNGSKDTGSNYSNRLSNNGGTDSTFTSRANIVFSAKSGGTQPELAVGYVVNIAGEEKLLIQNGVNAHTAGAGTAPDRIEVVGKWANTSDVMDVISFDNTGTGDYATGTNASVLGSDLTPASAVPAVPGVDSVQDNSIFVETDTARRYWFEPPTGVAYNINGATVTSQSKLLFSTLETPSGVVFKPDGTEMFLGDRESTKGGVSQWTLSTAWDVSTATLTGSVFNPSTQLGDRVVSGISLNPTGTIMYLTGRTNNRIYQYTLSTAWDLSTVSYASKTLDNSSQTTNAYAGQISSDGTKFYIGFVASPPDEILQYNLSTAWDISTASYSQSFTLTGGDGYTIGLQFLSDGTKFINQAGNSFEQYSMSTAWDISTASYDNVSVSQSAESYAYPVSWGNDGKSIYSVEGTLVSGDVNPTIHKYDVPLTGTWIMQPTYEDDFSTDKGWVTQYASKMAYNATTKKLDPVKYENSNNGDNITIAKELDFTLDTKFVIRFVLDFSQFGNSPFMTMGVSDKDSTVNADTAQDYLGIVHHNGSTWSAQVKDNTELGTFTNIGQASYSGHQSGFGTDYYCELIRNGDSFTINIRTGSHTGTTVVTATTTISTIGTVSNLKYIKFGSYDATSSSGYCTTTIDDLSVYNGVSSI